jgi:NADH:ubiquinone oxidoreductase subunit 3 (subunit A)
MLTKKYPESPLMQAQASPIDLNVGDATLARHPSHVREFKKQKKNKARVFEVGDPGQCSGSHKTLARWKFFFFLFFFFTLKTPLLSPASRFFIPIRKLKKISFFIIVIIITTVLISFPPKP